MTITDFWTTADTHFSHGNIIRYCNRPFSCSEEMDEVLITNWNSRVQKNDVVFHLGDFAFNFIDKHVQRLNGKIILIFGNHDKLAKRNANLFHSTHDYLEVEYKNTKIVMCHYAFYIWNKSHFDSINLFGHSHGRVVKEGKQMDVGVDTNNYFPYHSSEIEKIMNSKGHNHNFIERGSK